MKAGTISISYSLLHCLVKISD